MEESADYLPEKLIVITSFFLNTCNEEAINQHETTKSVAFLHFFFYQQLLL